MKSLEAVFLRNVTSDFTFDHVHMFEYFLCYEYLKFGDHHLLTITVNIKRLRDEDTFDNDRSGLVLILGNVSAQNLRWML